MPKLITYKELSGRISTPLGTLYSMVHAGTIPHVRVGPRSVRFDTEAIDKWIRERAAGAEVSTGCDAQ